MGWRRRHGNPDKNQAVIFDLVRDLPASVVITTGVGKGFPDGVIGFQGMTVLAEIKNDEAGGSLEESQTRFMQEWRGGPLIVASDGGKLVQQLIDLDRRTPPVRGVPNTWRQTENEEAQAVILKCLEAAKGLIVDMHDLPGLILKLRNG